jgi:4-hydroxy-3-polyprenylbenzoate decarboxylase
MKKILIGISGASGCIYGVRLLEVLSKLEVELHLIISEGAKSIINHETTRTLESVISLASYVYDNNNMEVGPASGSFQIDEMCIVPCSMKTLASVSHGYGNTLMSRAASCILKENKQLILVIRETPLDLPGIRNMLSAKEAGAVILPAAPGFYHQPKNIDQIVDFIVGKILDQLKISHSLFKRWG